MKAIWEDIIIAESDKTIVIERNHYFPPEAVHMEYMKASDTHTVCPWKGTASYYTIDTGDKQNKDAAWYYPQAKEAAKNIENHIAFWKGVKITP